MKPLQAIIFLSLAALLSSCYYDVEEELYPDFKLCDPENVTFSGTIQPLINTKCVSCHGNTNPGAGISLVTHSQIQAQALNGNLLGTMSHSSGFSPMPKNEPRLPQCQLEEVQIWIDNGAPND
ncbi:MAG: hypothetical protein EA392_04490 [Cryomorphaceae bacterium]|nr:MAG: hypothetical protein EA392_04490 [Cryomorphaceae bacterium]